MILRLLKKINKSRSKKEQDFFLKLSEILTFKPRKLYYYNRAFIHRTANLTDDEGEVVSYERLEFLGDILLSAVISEYLFQKVPQGNEGYLTKMRAKVVSREHLNELGQDLRLTDFLKSGISVSSFGPNIHGNIFEALVGAIFLDHGYEGCKKFISKRVIEPYVDIERLEGKIISYKSLIIEWCQKKKHNFKFEVYNEDKHALANPFFGVKLYINDEVVSRGRAKSKKKAEEIASKRAFYALQNKINPLRKKNTNKENV